MELFDDATDQDLDAKEAAERGETRQGRAKSVSSRTRKTGKMRKKRAMSRKTSGRRRTAKRAVPSGPAARTMTRIAEPPPIIPQPSLDADDEEPTSDEGEQRLEPPPPSASVIAGDDDDLFEYVT